MRAGITEFSTAITRRPATSAVDGLRADDQGAPDIAKMRNDHDDYCAALASTGASLIILPELTAFPDAQFVEDTALCLPEGVVFMSPGAPSRVGEVAAMEAAADAAAEAAWTAHLAEQQRVTVADEGRLIISVEPYF